MNSNEIIFAVVLSNNQIIFTVVVSVLVMTTMYFNWYWNRLDRWRRNIMVGYRVCIRVGGCKTVGVVTMVNEEKIWVRLPDGTTRARYRKDVWPA